MAALKIASLLALGASAAAPPAHPEAFTTWSANTTTTCVGAGCSAHSSKGTSAFDATSNLTSFTPARNGGQGQAYVCDFDQRIVSFVQAYNGRRCDYYCPMVDTSNLCSE